LAQGRRGALARRGVTRRLSLPSPARSGYSSGNHRLKNFFDSKNGLVLSVALVNRFMPPDGAPTAAALARLAALLTARAPALDLRMIGTGRAYAGGGAVGERRLWRRGIAAFTEGRRLADAAAVHDAVLSLTDPPFLAFHLARRLPVARRWIEWTMDLYPSALWAALGARPPGFPRLPGRRPDLRLHLGPGQAAFPAGKEQPVAPHLILPAGVRDAPPTPSAPPDARGGPVRLVYAGNLGRAHWAEALPLLAAACEGVGEAGRLRLTVAAHGARAAAVKAGLAEFPHVDLRDGPLCDAELDAAHVHVVSLRENWTHVCVPSKGISALCRGRPILFFGAAASDVWSWADGAGRRVDPDLAAARRDLPVVLRELADPDRLAAATMRAGRAGDRLRAAENAAADALTAWLGGGSLNV
jgi:hypothetical protein